MKILLDKILSKLDEEITILQKSYSSLSVERFVKIAGQEAGLQQARELVKLAYGEVLKGDDDELEG